MQYRILGPLEVLDDQGQPIPLGGQRERVLLAALALEANRVVSADRLIETLWGENPPATAANSLQVHVSRLRKRVTRPSGSDGPLQTEPPGYVLRVRPGELDAEHFEQLATASGPDEEPLAVSSRLADALALWRGPVLDGLELDPSGRADAARLEELRASAVEGRIQADLGLGRHAQLVGELEELVRSHPLREGLRAQLMVALYRSERQADALAVYRQTREVLSEELGIDPSTTLQDLELAILNQSPELGAPTRANLPTVQAEQPSGTVTLLFSDIEGSTHLWEQAPDAMADALKRHDEILRDAIEGSGGYVFKTVGDAFCAAFPTATEAVKAAETAQRTLLAEPWPAGTVLRVRMALHTGECEERDGDYFGSAVNRLARLEATAHGGQVILSRATADIVGDRLPPGVGLRHLGTHHLKDLGRPEEVFQLEMESLDTEFPPLRSLDNPKLMHNLPELVSSFVGREAEVIEVRKLIETSRLVTLTGAGGSGKTRLALQVAADLLDDFTDGVWLVELASLADPELVDSAVASVLRVQQQPGEDLLEILVRAIGSRKLLLVLDNCEHLLDTCAKLAHTLLRSCANVRVLATSREPVRVNGEHLYRVPSLAVPPAESTMSASHLGQFDALKLFADRGNATRSNFALDNSNSAVAASICRRLDGIPLALELAAARLSSLSIDEIDRRLDDRFRLLTQGPRTALPRQRTLEALIAWSYDLLDPSEQVLLCRLSVFAGGCRSEMAVTVCSGQGLEPLEVIDLLASLVDKSLVQADQTDTIVRYRLLESVRQFAARKLAQSGGPEEDTLRRLHAQAFLALAEAAASPPGGTGLSRWMSDLEHELDNLRAAMQYYESDRATVSEALRIAVSLRHFWFFGYRAEGVDCLEAILCRVDMDDVEQIGAVALLIAGYLRFEQGAYDVAYSHLTRAAEIARSVGDRSTTAEALGGLGLLQLRQGNLSDARDLAEESVGIAVTSGSVFVEADAFNHRATIRSACGDPDGANDFVEALSRFRAISDYVGLARALQNLAVLELKEGHVAKAKAHIQEALCLRDEVHGLHWMIDLNLYQGLVEILDGNGSGARQAFLELLAGASRAGAQALIAYAYLGLALCASLVHNLERGALLHGTADARFEERGEVIDAGLRALRDLDCSRLREALGSDAFEDAYQSGRRLSPDAAAAIAFEL